MSGQVCKRVVRRWTALGLAGFQAYREYLEAHPEEWRELDANCNVTISRFFRDRGVFSLIAENLFPSLLAQAKAQGRDAINVWCVGCAGGEEVYSLVIAWRMLFGAHAEAKFCVLGTDVEAYQLERAARAVYISGCLKELSPAWCNVALEPHGTEWSVRAPFREGVTLAQQDVREEMPNGPFELILCRNSVFTYFNLALQQRMLRGFAERLRAGGFLILGKHERLPQSECEFRELTRGSNLFQLLKSV